MKNNQDFAHLIRQHLEENQLNNIVIKPVANGLSIKLKDRNSRFFNCSANYKNDTLIDVSLLYRQDAYFSLLKDKSYEIRKTYLAERDYHKYSCKVSLDDFWAFFDFVVTGDPMAKNRLESVKGKIKGNPKAKSAKAKKTTQAPAKAKK